MDLFQLAHSDLRDIGHQVVGNAVGVFADESALVRPDWIKISQESNVERIVGFVYVFKNTFYIQLGCSVRIGGGKREIFRDRNALGLTVNGGR